MAEKGGKGSKVSFAAAASPKGKDTTAAKSKKGQRVHFGSEDAYISISSKSGGKFDNPKGDWGKGGKGSSMANGGKKPVSKAPSPLELRVEQELLQNAKCMMDCEAAEILQGIQDQMVMLSEDPTIKIPVSFDRALQYAKTHSHYEKPMSVRRLFEISSVKKFGVTDGEMCLIANMCPESIDEAFALLPSLKDKRDKLKELLKNTLDDLAKYKHSA